MGPITASKLQRCEATAGFIYLYCLSVKSHSSRAQRAHSCFKQKLDVLPVPLQSNQGGPTLAPEPVFPSVVAQAL